MQWFGGVGFVRACGLKMGHEIITSRITIWWFWGCLTGMPCQACDQLASLLDFQSQSSAHQNMKSLCYNVAMQTLRKLCQKQA